MLLVTCAGGAALSVARLLIIFLAPPFGLWNENQVWGTDDPGRIRYLQMQVQSADEYAAEGSQALANGERIESAAKYFSALIMLPRNELTAERVHFYQKQFWRTLTDG
jgi:hypothetical protein